MYNGRNEDTYSLSRKLSSTSTICSIRLFALSSSLPTVMRIGLVRKVDASRRTDSGHVAETGYDQLSILNTQVLQK